ncbi:MULTISPECIES: hypothetical protein [unclassified Nocardia]|uniref:hypothetical protein n=1 Tax=unclassified Nocardia TaxID=2637762 RepID=UPI001CE3BF8E|nr:MULTISPECIES: hypothetical protein [unclassified Nocardia]
MADHQLKAAEIAWWAFATAPTTNWPPIYDEYGFDTFEDVRDDLTKSMRAAGFTLELSGADEDLCDYEYRLLDANRVVAGRAFIVHARDEIEDTSSSTAPDPPAREVTFPRARRDDPPF